MMNPRELSTLNALVTVAAENIPGGLTAEEEHVAKMVGIWTIDGVPVRQICPYCGSVAPTGEGRVMWLEDHVDSGWHHRWWGLVNKLSRRSRRR